jgi:sugar/nucleoside kinase (ribokinase family)
MFSGGSAANAIRVLAKIINWEKKNIKYSSAFAGLGGADVDGEFFRSEHEKEKVDLKYFSNLRDVRSDCCMVLVTPDGERTFRTAIGASARMDLDWFKQIDFNEFEFVLLEGYLFYNGDFVLEVIDRIVDSGARVVLDLGSPELVKTFSAELTKVLTAGKIDIILSNASEAAAFTGVADSCKNCLKLAEFCRIAVVKVGADGAWISSEGNLIKIAGEQVDVVDTTGAGDSWAAAFLYGLLDGKSLSDSGKFAGKIASLMVQNYGTNMELKVDCFL